MNFKPKTEKEIIQTRLWKAAVYPFHVIEAEEKPSSKGDQMIQLRVAITDDAGNARTISDYLLEKSPLKLRHAAEACGVLDRYEAGSLTADDFLGKRGKAKVGVEKDRAKKFPDKNVILDYVTASAPVRTYLSAERASSLRSGSA